MSRRPVHARDVDVRVGTATLRVRRLSHAAIPEPGRLTIVFLHDSLGCIALWRDFPEQLALATQCDALVYDRQGYGESSPFDAPPRTTQYLEEEADRLPDLLGACGVERAILFGHSDGGSIALVAAAKHPTGIQAVVSEGAHVFVEDITLDGIRHARELMRTTDLRSRVARYHGARTDEVIARWIETWLRPEFRDFNIEHFLRGIRVPTLVLQGMRDEFGSEAQVRAIAGGVAAASEAHMIPGAAHNPHKEATEDTLRITVAFLRKHGVIASPND